MSTKSPQEIAESISKLLLWDGRTEFSWGLVPQSTEFPYIGQIVPEKEGAIKGRVMLFPGFQVFRDFLMTRQFSDYGVYTSLFDVPHYSVILPRKGKAQCALYEPGFLPKEIGSDSDDPLFRSLLVQTYGLLMRFEGDAKIANSFAKDQSIFSRKEISQNNWVDGPLRVPSAIHVIEERIAFKKSDSEKAAALPQSGETWEVEFAMFPQFRTAEPRPRFLYVFAGVDSSTGEKRFCHKMSVDGKPDGLRRLWEKHAERLLESILKYGKTPAEIRVRSPRVMRFLRPLGMHLPFKLSQYEKLPAIERYFKERVSLGGE